jgi:hypothetical protein
MFKWAPITIAGVASILMALEVKWTIYSNLMGETLKELVCDSN